MQFQSTIGWLEMLRRHFEGIPPAKFKLIVPERYASSAKQKSRPVFFYRREIGPIKRYEKR